MRDSFKVWLRSEIEEAAHYNGWFVFNLSFLGNDLLEDKTEPPHPPSYTVSSNFYGNLRVQDEDLIPAMQGSPFYKCFMDFHLSLTILGHLHQVISIMIVIIMIAEILLTQ